MPLIRQATAADADACAAVLAALPDHFTPDMHDAARAAVREHPAWVAEEGGSVVGFLLVERRFPTSAEVTYAGVIPSRWRTGVGRQLVDTALAALAVDGVVVVEAKTLDESAGYEPYVGTRAFWSACGFHQVDCIDPLPGWQPGNPSAIYVAALRATR